MRALLILLLLLCAAAVPALACSPTPTPTDYVPPPAPSLEEMAQSAPIIFQGTILREVDLPESGRHYEVQVSRYLKGQGFNVVIIHGYGYGTDCLPTIYEGMERIFFVRDYGIHERIPVYALLVEYNPNQQSRVIAVTGEGIAPLPLPIDIQMSRLAENGELNWLYMPLSILAGFFSLIALWLWRHSRRGKRKVKREELAF